MVYYKYKIKDVLKNREVKIMMKKTKKKALACAAAIAKKSSYIWANVPCIYWEYQPKMPKAVKKLRKF